MVGPVDKGAPFVFYSHRMGKPRSLSGSARTQGSMAAEQNVYIKQSQVIIDMRAYSLIVKGTKQSRA